MNLQGKWCRTIEGQADDTIEFMPDGDTWSILITQQDGTPVLSGVGFEHQGFLFTSRGIAATSTELGGTVGLVRYDICDLGNLPARWYHTSLRGKLSDGLSTHGPKDKLVGEYRADYEDASGNAFNPLRKTISETNRALEFSWWDEEKFHYVGVGQKINGSLFAAWGPPGSIIQFANYDIRNASSNLCGSWYDYRRGRDDQEYLSAF